MRVSKEQWNLLLDYLESHPKLAKAYGSNNSARGRAESARHWQEVANLVNCISNGVTKTAKEWSLFISNYKSKLKKMVARINACGTDNGEGEYISDTDQRFMDILGPDFLRTTSNVYGIPMQDKDEQCQSTEADPLSIDIEITEYQEEIVTTEEASSVSSREIGDSDNQETEDIMVDRVFIGLIKAHDELYNRDHPEYNNQEHRDNVWRKIASVLDEKDDTCKEKWQSIRENFHKSLMLLKQKKSAPATIRERKYFNRLLFLIPHLIDENPGLDIEDTGGKAKKNKNRRSDPYLSKVPRKVINRSNSINELHHQSTEGEEISENQINQSLDPLLEDFFMNMAHTVAKFPLNKQLEIKGKLFEMVHAREMELADCERDLLS